MSPIDVTDVALGEDFRPSAIASSFELDRAIHAYIPLLKACYALANQESFSFPDGYEAVGEIRADQTELAEALPASIEAQEAVRNDFAAVEAAMVDPSAFGFVVREQDTGHMLVCLRGTRTPRDWVRNLTAMPNVFSLAPEFGLVHLGFEIMYRSVRASIERGLAAVGLDTRVSVVGHSLGGAMRTLAAVARRNFLRTRVDISTFGGPRVGTVSFRRRFNRELPDCFRVTSLGDIVPHVPFVFLGWNHVGEEIEVDGNLDDPHSLDAYLAGMRNIDMVREVTMSGEATVLPKRFSASACRNSDGLTF